MTSPAFNSIVVLQINGKPVGTGFLVHESGLLATCCHILIDVFKTSPAEAVGQTLDFVMLQDRELASPPVRQSQVTTYHDEKNDVALLQIQGELPSELQPVKLIRSQHPFVEGTDFRLDGYGEVPDRGVLYDSFGALGKIVGTILREKVKVLLLKSPDLLKGLSGAPIYAVDLGGVIGMQSRRLNLHPGESGWARDTGFGCVSEAIEALAPEILKLHEPALRADVSSSASIINAQTLQFTGGINAQTVMFADLGVAKFWQRPEEVRWPVQQSIHRATELRMMRERLEDDDLNSAFTGLALCGMGGSGKTTLAAQYARQYGQAEAKIYPGGILWVKLGAQFDPQQDFQPILARWAEYGYGGAQKLADLIGQQRVDVTPDDIQQLLSGHGKMLAILDDVHSGEHLNCVLEALPLGTNLLITTLNEQSLKGSGITPQFLEVQGLHPEDAIAFLQSRLPLITGNLLRQLAETFNFHAQALLLITAELRKSADPEALVHQLLYQQDHKALEPIRTAFEYSYQQLEEEGDRQRFQQLGTLCPPPADFSVELAAMLWDLKTDSALQFLQVLQERTLVAEGSDRRWSIDSLMYRFARDLLKQEPELYELSNSRYILCIHELAVSQAAWNSHESELPHLKYVGNQFIQELTEAYTFDFETLQTTSDEALSDKRRGYWRAVADYFMSARSYLFQPEAKGFAERWLKALVCLGQILNEPTTAASGFYMLGQWHLTYDYDEQSHGAQTAIEMFDRAHPLWEQTGDTRSVGYALVGKGNAQRLLGKTKQALETFETALVKVRAVGEDWQLKATLLASLSRQYLLMNEHDSAQQYLEQATELCQGQPFNYLIVEIAQQFSALSLKQSKPEISLERLQEVRKQAVQLGSDRIVAEIDTSIGFSQFYLGNGDAALQTFESVLKQSETVAYPQLRPPTLMGLALVHFTNSEFQHARNLLEQSLQMLNRYQNKSLEAQVLASLGEVTFAMNEADAAMGYLKRALPLLHMVQDTTTAVKTLNTIGLIYQQTNRISEGLTFLEEELPKIRELNNAGAEVTILKWLAQLLNNAGSVSQAMAYFDEAEPIIAKIDNVIERATIQTLTTNLYLSIGKTDKAVDKAREVIDIWRKLNNQPKLSEALMTLAGVFFRQSKMDEVKQLLEEVNDLSQEEDQTYVRALYYNLRGALELQAANLDPNRVDEAQQMFERSVIINESVQNPEICIANLLNLGSVRLFKQDWVGAQNFFEESLAVAEEQKSAPLISTTLTNLGWLAYLRGDTKEGIQYFEKAISRMEEAGITTDAGNQNIGLLRLITRYIRQEDVVALPETSLKMLLNVENWQNLRFILEARKESFWTDDADQILTATIRDAEFRKQSSLMKVLSYYQSLLDRCRKEKRIPIVQAMQHERESIAVEHWWASRQRQNRNYGVALTHINRVLEVDFMDEDALIERGWIHRGLGRLPEAIADFDAVLKLQKLDYRPYQGKGVALLEWGKIQEAIAILTKAIDLGSDEAYNYHWRATAYQLLDDFKSALEDLDHAVKISPQTSDHCYRRALLYLNSRKFSEARRELTNVIELDREKSSALAFDYFWRGIANDQLEDAEGARLNWKKGQNYVKTGISLWSRPLYSSVNGLDQVEDEYRTLLDGYYPWHILHVQIQNLKILEKLYPGRTCYSTVKKMLEQKLVASRHSS